MFGERGFHALTPALMAQKGQNSCIQALSQSVISAVLVHFSTLLDVLTIVGTMHVSADSESLKNPWKGIP